MNQYAKHKDSWLEILEHECYANNKYELNVISTNKTMPDNWEEILSEIKSDYSINNW